MKTVCKKLLSLTLVAMMLVSAVPFQAFATEGETTAALTETIAATVAATEAAETVAATEATVAATEAVVVPETTAATEAAVEAVPAVLPTTPAVAAVGDYVNVVFTLKEYPQANVLTLNNMKIGYKATSIPDGNAVVNSYAQYAGSSNGKFFSHWELADGTRFDPYSTNITDSIVAPGSTLYLYGVVANQTYRITLDLKGGSLASRLHEVRIGESYNAAATLPTPTRQHYDFLYWYKVVNNQEIPVNGDSIVTDISILNAKWALKNYNVTFQAYSGSAWIDVKTVAVPALSTLTTANGYFPTDAEVKANFGLADYTIVGWEIGESDKAFTAGSTQVSEDLIIRPRYQRSITLMANNPNDYTSNSTKSIVVEIGEPIPTLPNPGARDGYTFVDWVTADQTTVVCTKANLANTAVHPIYTPALGNIFYARWTESTVVYLYIHTNNNTQTATKVVPYYEAPSTGAFDMNLINMYAIFSEYGNYDDNVDAIYGWYEAAQWKNYCANTAANAATTYYDIAANGTVEFHIMLVNNGGSTTNNNVNNNNYNNNISTADPSNPTTGDTIAFAVTVMTISAAALAVMFFLKKRKAA